MQTTGQAPSLAGLTIIITGGTGVIGGAAASVFMKEAKGIVIFSRGANNSSPFAEADNILMISGNITSPQDVQRLCDLTRTRFGRIDALINCAGVVPKHTFMEMPHQNWQTAIEINLVGYALLCRSVLPHMIRDGFGRIINITTRLAANPKPLMSAYSSSKAGAHILTSCIASEIAQQGHFNILINDLVPGPTGKNGQNPLLVVPFLRELILLPANGPTGKTYFRGRIYDLFGTPMA